MPAGRGLGVLRKRIEGGWLSALKYFRTLPRLDVELTNTPVGRSIAEHLAIRDHWRLMHRAAQGVLLLPEHHGDYVRGRHRQALRTNVRHAERAGITVVSQTLASWSPGKNDRRSPYMHERAPVEHWAAIDREGVLVADALLSVDRDVALLQALTSSESFARWQLHDAIVKRLCGQCSVMLTNSDDVPFLPAGTQHFQRLLGYSIVQIRTVRIQRSTASDRGAIQSRLPRRAAEHTS